MQFFSFTEINKYLSPLTRFLLYLKITAFFIVFASLQIHARGVAQTFRLDMTNGSITTLIKEIQRQTGYAFLYNREDIKEIDAISIAIESDDINEVLTRSLKDLPLDFLVKENEKAVVLKRRSSKINGRERILANLRQQSTVQGIVVDTAGVALPGVTVSVKNQTTLVTSTDLNGRYVLQVPENAILVFTMVGYHTQEVNVGSEREVNIALEMSSSLLDDVVVVGFGTQKRTDMVGSVTSIKPDELKVPSSNLTTALAGRAAGVIAYQRSGEPGQDNADFFVRGVTTFGNNRNPLILIDGMELTTTDLARLQPEDISSFSIMKDATSTAVYGARGANGVILVTTKQGSVGKAKFSFRLENSISQPTTNIELADPITYMRMHNEAILTRTPIGELGAETVLYPEEKIANTIAGANPYAYPANDWRKMLLKDYAMNQRYNLNISGGGGVARYYVSGSLNQDNGLMKVDNRNNFNNNIDLKSYTLRSNVTIDVTKTTEMIVRLSGNFDDYTGPIDGGQDMYRKIMRSNPVLFPAYFEPNEQFQYVNHIMFGNYGNGAYINPYAEMVKGYKDYARSLMLAQVEVSQDLSFLTEGLSVRAMVNTNRESFFDVSRFYNPFWYELDGYDKFNNRLYLSNINEDTATEYLGYDEGDKLITSSFYMESMLRYNRTFNDRHGLSGLLVYIMRNTLRANAGNLQLSLPFRNMGLSGRFTYALDNKYFAEFNFGYNGSERFHESRRFGFFPSGGLAWTVSNEKFFEPLNDVVSNLRLRATYGLIGNDAIGAAEDRFFYLSNVNMNDDGREAFFGRDRTERLSGISISRYSNPDITWEVSTKKNLALELGLFNKVDLVAEYFTEHRTNILMDRASIPITMGLAAPIRANVGEATGRGVDMSLNYAHSFMNGLWLSAMGNFTYARSKFEVYEEPQYLERYRYRVGHPINQEFGYIAERLFVDDAEAANSPLQNFGEYMGGDIKYLDVNRDGQITEADMVPLGNPTLPEIIYGIGFSAGYKGVDLSIFFQGLTNESFWIDANATAPFHQYYYDGETLPQRTQNALIKDYADSYWSEENRDVYALWPRLSPQANSNNGQRSTWFMRDGTFLRLKQLEIGYTFPRRLMDKLHTSNLRIYLNGTNLLTFSKFRMWDVEMAGNGLGYPVQKVFNIGLNVAFN